MKPIKFPFANITFAKNQPEYMPLPAWTDGNQVVSGWSMTWLERIKVLLSGVIWIRQVTFGQPLQPLRPQVPSPFPKMPMVPNDNILRGPTGKAINSSREANSVLGHMTPEAKKAYEKMEE
jgi:hypothetical protein